MYQTIVLFVLFSVIAYYGSQLWRDRRVYLCLRHLPGPPSLPLLGSSYLFFGKTTSEIFYTFTQLTRKYSQQGSPVRFYLGTMPFVIISRPEDARVILNSAACLEKPWIYRFTPLEGIFSLPAQKWRLHRKIIQPSFSWNVLKSFIPLFQAKVHILLDNLQIMANQHEPFDVYDYVSACTLDMVYATTLGLEMDIQRQPRCNYLEVLDELFELVTKRVTNVLLHPEWLYRLTSHHRRESKARQVFTTPAKEILRHRPIKEEYSKENATTTAEPQILIQQLYAAAEKNCHFDRNAIEKELNTMIFGGNETTASTVANTLLLIAMHPPVQDQLITELERIFGNNIDEISIQQLQQLEYMEMVLKESMRLFPITAILGRTTESEVQLNQLTIPAGVNIAIDVFNIHRNPRYWGSDADMFIPERFQCFEHNPVAFLAFSAGPRNCIGKRYAWISMKIMLAGVLHRFRLSTELRMEEVRLKAAMTIKVVNKHILTMSMRTKQ
ncbi:cytochrome P450 4c21-like [Sabethes cyaneus]|uniref:cytochrome P450 4c21-like n=1 Tax=Sabethes cyaneus TaxID=53552 RepID=UPI00237DB54C|nr:cytochrome P450 4c21-like [Sabethes cyaneus]